MIEHFHRPGTVREALALMKRYQGKAVYLAGGTYLNSNACARCPEHRVSLTGLAHDRTERKLGARLTRALCPTGCTMRPEHVISLAGLGHDRVETGRSTVVIGPLCTLQRVADDRRVPAGLRAAVAQIVPRNVREMATLGGHLASNPPYSDVIPMLVALGAKVSLAQTGAIRTLPVAEYAADPPAGLVTRIVVPKPAAARRFACRNARASANARSVVSVAVSLAAARDVVKSPIVAVGGVGDHVTRLKSVEEALDGKPLPALDELQALASRAVRPAADLTGSAAFRRHQAGVAVALALHEALGRKRGRS